MNRPCTFFMLLKATRHWRELPADAQRKVFDDTLELVFNGYPDLRMSRYAGFAFHGGCTDVIAWETHDVAQYHEAVSMLRTHAFFGAPLFEVVDVIAGVQDEGDPDDALAAALEALEAVAW